jgi:alanine-glyoxylate transaminase/serine-glyoxylate transaminase/serine-pyruvate transaminase
MGESARQENVLAVLAAIEQALAKQGKLARAGASLAAALESYART